MKLMLHHLTGSLRGQTQYFDTERLRFGTAETCEVIFDAERDAMVSPLHAEMAVEDHAPVLRDLTGQNALIINNRQTVEARVHDGDLVQLGPHGPLVRFRLLPQNARAVKPWRYIVEDSRDIVVRTPHRRYTSFLHLARHVLADIAHYGTPGVKAVALLTAILPLVLIMVLGLALFYEYRVVGLSEQRIAELLGQLETGRLGRAELEERIATERETVERLQGEQTMMQEQLRAALEGQEAARRSQEELRNIREQLKELESAQRFAEDIIRRFEKGVGLLQGGYGLKETATGRPLRYKGFDEQGVPILGPDGTPQMTLEGDGPKVVVFYAGTGFLIDRRGTVLTNRHVVQMWEVYEPIQATLNAGFEPDPHILRIFFPGFAQPYDLEVLAVSDVADLGILRTTVPPRGVPPLQLASPGGKIHVGEPVLVMSYPGTFDSLLSRLPVHTSKELIDESEADLLALPVLLAERGLVRPLATHGHITDVSRDVITYEARAAGGSSGGPVLNREGLVIAVNHSEIQELGGMNLGLPIRFVTDHLDKLDAARKTGN